MVDTHSWVDLSKIHSLVSLDFEWESKGKSSRDLHVNNSFVGAWGLNDLSKVLRLNEAKNFIICSVLIHRQELITHSSTNGWNRISIEYPKSVFHLTYFLRSGRFSYRRNRLEIVEAFNSITDSGLTLHLRSLADSKKSLKLPKNS